MIAPSSCACAIVRQSAPRCFAVPLRQSASRAPLLSVHVSAAASAAADVQSASTNGADSTTVPVPITVNVPEAKPSVLPPAASYANIVALGAAKAAAPAGRIFLLGIMGGAYISFGAFLMAFVAGTAPGLMASNPGIWKMMSACLFPVGLMMVLLGGAELYTGNTMTCTAAFYERKASLGDLLKNWLWSFSGNFAGSILMTAAVAYSGVLAGNSFLANAAVAKTSLPFGVAVVRAVLANWLVCVAVKQASAASSLTGKVLGIWPPIASFVCLGLEHSVANMFIIPMGMVLGAKVSVSDFIFNNLIPVTLGNTLAGAGIMAGVYALSFGSFGQKVWAPKQA